MGLSLRRQLRNSILSQNNPLYAPIAADQARKCARKGCKAWADGVTRPSRYGSAFAAPGPGSPYVPIHCARHQCPERDETGKLCTRPKRRTEEKCAHHGKQRTCAVADCAEPTKKDEDGFTYCGKTHGCVQADCGNMRVGVRDGVMYEFCTEHGCGTDECRQAKGAAGRYCDGHTCKEPDCLKEVAGLNRRDPGNLLDVYCLRHLPCARANCNNPVYQVSCEEYRRHCFAHHCEYGHGCDDGRLDGPGANACAGHRCCLPGGICYKKMEDGSRFCADHKCSTADCWKERSLGSEYCAEHLCRLARINGCKEAGTDARNGYCEKHEPCTEAGCREMRFNDQGQIRERCEMHLRPGCTVANCGNRADGNLPVCANHRCTTGLCPRPRLHLISPYCDLHKCRHPACFRARPISDTQTTAGAQMLLLTAGVHSPSLMAAAMAGPGVAASAAAGSSGAEAATALLLLDYSPFCRQHSCAAEQCEAGPEEGSKFCAKHECHQADCHAQAVGTFCAKHTCQADECDAPLRADGARYCPTHACRDDACNDQAIGGKAPDAEYCDKHADAYHAFTDSHDPNDPNDPHAKWAYGGIGWGGMGGSYTGAGHPARPARPARGPGRRPQGGLPWTATGLRW